jgi:hypothetical protein
MVSPADKSPGPAFSSTVWFPERPNFIEGLQETTMSDQDTMRIVADVVDKFSGPLKEMQKTVRELSKEPMRRR